jgi:hypothetical protein
MAVGRAGFVYSPGGAGGVFRAAFVGKPADPAQSAGRVGVWRMGITRVGGGSTSVSPTTFPRASFVAGPAYRAEFVFTDEE